MERIYSIYKITNNINNKIYIGQAQDYNQRWRQHKAESKKEIPRMIINRAMKKHGLNNFLFEVIASCKTWEDANETETLLVSQYESHISTSKGYNVSAGGCNAPKTDEWKKKVALILTSNIDVFLDRANQIHGNKFDYSDSIYVSAKDKIKIICKKHGVFYQTPDKHLNQKQGCPKCNSVIGGQTRRLFAALQFEEKSKLIHNYRYNYSKVEYINAITKVCILCPMHGLNFWQTPNNHLNGYGCPKCGREFGSVKPRKFR